MKKVIYLLLILLAVLNTRAQYYYIRGSVFDASSNKPLQNVRVDLKNADNNTLLSTTTTDANGNFIFSVKTTYMFIVEASLYGYTSKSTSKFYFGEFQESKTLDKIYLQNNGMRADTDDANNNQGNNNQDKKPPTHEQQRVDTLPPEKVIEKRFDALEILPTKGAYGLFYALNPELQHMHRIPENYNIRYPKFPSFSDIKPLFNERFKKDKRNGEPFISLQNFKNDMDDKIIQSVSGKKALSFIHFPGIVSNPPQADEMTGEKNLFPEYSRPKKFVFVMWKYGPDGKPITDGEEVSNKYLVKYYTDRVRGDTSAYNKASNATYGYAPMLDAKYYIEVYEQATMRRVVVSDNEVDPHLYFERRDIWISFNIAYTKILIQVYDK